MLNQGVHMILKGSLRLQLSMYANMVYQNKNDLEFYYEEQYNVTVNVL